MSMNNLKVSVQYILPKRLITRIVGVFANAKMGRITTWAIKKFAQCYDINLVEAGQEIKDYKTFNDFFSRSLKKGARPIDKAANSVVFPVDGTVSECQNLDKDILLQAKNHYYSCADLLASSEDAKIFENGQFITIYLSPKDYHRVHIPFAGKLSKMTYVPGEAFSVNAFNAQNIPELFTQNERVVCIFDADIGKMAVVMVGATIVRSIATTWAGVVAPNAWRKISTFDYQNQNIVFNKGDEIGKFMMGSTVICLFEKNKLQMEKNTLTGYKTKMGTIMGTIAATSKAPTNKQKKSSKKQS